MTNKKLYTLARFPSRLRAIYRKQQRRAQSGAFARLTFGLRIDLAESFVIDGLPLRQCRSETIRDH